MHKIATPHIWKLILTRYSRQERAEMKFFLFTMLSRIPQAGPECGWFVDACVHEVLSQGGTFTLTKMSLEGKRLTRDNGEEELLSFHPLEPRVFHGSELLSNTVGDSDYFIPSAANDPTFDSFFRVGDTGIGLQMTLAKTHNLTEKGLRMLAGRLSTARHPRRNTWISSPFRFSKSMLVPMSVHSLSGVLSLVTVGQM
ncbi:hypothetical protein B0H10DRAFT_670370 [Mycena sp. CBHHK59/15]|nr:hypothetical protein B0H10DRAFT_670370 [Mycena sp. CBHHK59/15]